MSKLIIWEMVVLGAGTVFAWSNFIYELVNWLNKKACTTGCFVGANPFLTPCFYGAITFAIAFILSVLIYKAK